MLVGHASAAYDPFGTAVWLSYDPLPGVNLLDDPAVAHEFTHYGQNILTCLGIQQTLMFHELYAAAVQILLKEPEVRLPLTRNLPRSSGDVHWHFAEIALQFQQEVIGQPSPEVLLHLQTRSERLSTLVQASFTPGADNPFYILYKGKGPGFGIRSPDGTDTFFALNGHFLQEIHARSTELVTRWAHERLSLDDAIGYFLSQQRNPYGLLYLLVSKFVTERAGKGVLSVQDCVLLCHLCAQIALNTPGLEVVEKLPRKELHTLAVRFEYIHPGQVFLDAISVALYEWQGGGWAVEHYFDLMQSVLSRLGWPSFERIMVEGMEQEVAPLESLVSRGCDGYHSCLARKLQDSREGVAWLLKHLRQRDLMEFVRAGVVLVADGIVRGPILATPGTYTKIIPQGRSHNEVSQDEMQGLAIAFLTTKLWHSTDLTCLTLPGSPFQGSFIDCPFQDQCLPQAGPVGAVPICKNTQWHQFLDLVPGLAQRLQDLVIAP